MDGGGRSFALDGNKNVDTKRKCTNVVVVPNVPLRKACGWYVLVFFTTKARRRENFERLGRGITNYELVILNTHGLPSAVLKGTLGTKAILVNH